MLVHYKQNTFGKDLQGFCSAHQNTFGSHFQVKKIIRHPNMPLYDCLSNARPDSGETNHAFTCYCLYREYIQTEELCSTFRIYYAD